jgi:hypothetical protein
MQDLSIFSHLPQISSQPPGIHWTIDPKLHRYIQQFDHLLVDSIAYHLVTTDPNPTVNACLTSFLAHVAFVPAHRLRATHTLLQQYYTEDITDLYQLGLEIICEPRKFLSNFDATRSIDTGYWYPNFYKWSQQKFDLRLIDKIRSQKGMSGFRRTNLGLVTRATPTKVVKALTHQGYPTDTHPTYLVLQSCLEKAVKAKRFDTANPQPAHYAEILALYRQRQVISLDVDRIIGYLDRLGSAVSNYDRLRVTSIDLPLTKDGDSTLLDTIADPTNPIDTAVLTEYQQQVDRVKTIFTALLEQLPIDSDRILLLFNGLNFTQREVGIELECNQSTAMHRHNRILAKLAQDLHQQINPHAPIPALKSETLNQIIPQIINFCQHYYSDPLKKIMIADLPAMGIEADRVLFLYYGLGLRSIQVSGELNHSMVLLYHNRVIHALASGIYWQINQNSALPPLSTTHEEDPIFKQTIVYCQQYYRDLLADTIGKFENQEPQLIIDRVQSRWQIQFTQEKIIIVDGEPRIIAGHALKALTKIINKKT